MDQAPLPSSDCPLTGREQTRNVLIVGFNTALCYLASPVLYVDAVHTSLLNDVQTHAGREALAKLSNLPASAYMVFAITPLFVAWAFPQIRLLKRTLVSCYALLALGSAAMVALLLVGAPWWFQAAAIVAHGGLVGAARTVAVAFEFEVLGLAVTEARRGQALGIAYGLGPILAIIANLVAQLLLTSKIGPVSLPGFGAGASGPSFSIAIAQLGFPNNFAAVFASTVPIMLVAALLCSALVIPVPLKEIGRQPFFEGVFGGISTFLGRRTTAVAVFSAVLITCGYQIISNLTLYTGLLFHNSPSDTAGYQKAILYTCKVAMGISMGWLLTRASPRSAVLVSATVGLSAIVWALFVPAPLFLLSWGLLGGGQLHGVYATNYILGCAPKELMRKFMAFTMVSMLPAAFVGPMYGTVTDYFGAQHGQVFGFQMSFVLAGALVLLGIILTWTLPPRPRPVVEGGTR